MNTPTYHVHHTHDYIHHTKWNHTLASDYSTLSQSVLNLSMKVSMPLPATRDILVCNGTNRTLLERTSQTRTQQLPEVYVKVVHSAVLTSILLISTMLNQLSHRPWPTVCRRCLHTPQCWNLRIYICSPLHRPRITPGISSLHQIQACHGAHCSHGSPISFPS